MFAPSLPFYSPETISFQNDRFFRAMTEVIEQFRGSNTPTNVTELELAVAKVIKDNTNINVDAVVADLPFGVEVPRLDKNSPLLEGYGWKDESLSKQSLSDIRKNSKKEVRGYVDTNAGWVDGYFANLPPVKLILNRSMIFGNPDRLLKIFDGAKYTSREIAACILHEVGHVWSFLVFLVRFRTTNQALAAMSRELDATTDFGKREIIIKEASNLMDLSEVDAQNLSTKNNTTIYTVIIGTLARKNRSQSGTEGYDINSFEALSDLFATRHGAGKDLVTGLDKLYKGSIYRRGWLSYFFMEFAKLALFALGIMEIGTGAIFGGYTTFLILTCILLADSHTDWYDKPGARFRRIRNQLVEELKSTTLSKEDSHRIREDIQVIDDVNEKYKDHTQLIGLVYNYLIPSGINKRKQIEFEQQLEEMASNRLFVYANQIKFLN